MYGFTDDYLNCGYRNCSFEHSRLIIYRGKRNKGIEDRPGRGVLMLRVMNATRSCIAGSIALRWRTPPGLGCSAFWGDAVWTLEEGYDSSPLPVCFTIFHGL